MPKQAVYSTDEIMPKVRETNSDLIQNLQLPRTIQCLTVYIYSLIVKGSVFTNTGCVQNITVLMAVQPILPLLCNSCLAYILHCLLQIRNVWYFLGTEDLKCRSADMQFRNRSVWHILGQRIHINTVVYIPWDRESLLYWKSTSMHQWTIYFKTCNNLSIYCPKNPCKLALHE